MLPVRAQLGSEYKREKHARRQREILDAAAATFRDRGFHAATMHDVAERIGMRPGSLYHYLPSKELALESICRATGAEFNARLTELLRAGGAASDMIRRGIELHLHPDTIDYVNAFAFYRRSLPEAAKAQLNLMAKQYLDTWEAIVRGGIKDGSLRKDLEPRAAAVGIVAMCNGVIGWFARKPSSDITGTVQQLSSLVLGGLLTRE